MKFIPVGRCADIPHEQARTFDCDGRSIAVFHLGDGFHAVDGIRPHRGGPLAEGDLDGQVVTCPWHGWRFDVTTGANPDMPAARVAIYPTRVEGDSLAVEVPAHPIGAS